MRALLTGVEDLGLDTQSLRDFHIAVRSGQIQEDPYKHILVTLQSQLDKVTQGAAEPAAVGLLLGRLDKKLQVDLAGSVKMPEVKQVVMSEDELQRLLKSASTPAMVAPVPLPQDPAVNEEILHQLRMMNEKVKDLKSGQFGTISHIPGTSSEASGPEAVFINPIDESKVEELQANISIDSKKSNRNLKDKIRRLKELKSGKKKEEEAS